MVARRSRMRHATLLAGVAERRIASPYVREIVVQGSMHSAALAGDPFRCSEFVHRGAAVPGGARTRCVVPCHWSLRRWGLIGAWDHPPARRRRTTHWPPRPTKARRSRTPPRPSRLSSGHAREQRSPALERLRPAPDRGGGDPERDRRRLGENLIGAPGMTNGGVERSGRPEVGEAQASGLNGAVEADGTVAEVDAPRTELVALSASIPWPRGGACVGAQGGHAIVGDQFTQPATG